MADQEHNALHLLVKVQGGGVDEDGVAGLVEGGHFPGTVLPVPLGQRRGLTGYFRLGGCRSTLQQAAAGPGVWSGGEEHLDRGIRKDRRADVPSIENQHAGVARCLAKPLVDPVADRGEGAHLGYQGGYLGGPNEGLSRCVVEERDHGAGNLAEDQAPPGGGSEDGLGAPHRQVGSNGGEGPVERAGIEVAGANGEGDGGGGARLPRRRGTVDGNDGGGERGGAQRDDLLERIFFRDSEKPGKLTAAHSRLSTLTRAPGTALSTSKAIAIR